MALIGAVAVIATGSDSFAEEKKATQEEKGNAERPRKEQGAPAATAGGAATDFLAVDENLPEGRRRTAKPVYFTGKDGRVETGQPVVAAVLIEPQSEPRKILRITLPLGMSLQQGTRAIIDQGQPMTAPYVICFINGCMADYEASQALIDTMKKGKGLVIQGINGANQPISLVLPLNDFAKAYDGPPTDPKDLDRRNEELRKKFEGAEEIDLPEAHRSSR